MPELESSPLHSFPKVRVDVWRKKEISDKISLGMNADTEDNAKKRTKMHYVIQKWINDFGTSKNIFVLRVVRRWKL